MGIILSVYTSNILCELSSSDWSAIISSLVGAFAVVVGTLLGWFLNTLSSRGKITFTLCDWRVAINNYTSREDGKIREYNTLYFKIDIYNGANFYKIIRDVNIVFEDKDKKTIKTIKPNDEDLTYTSNRPVCVKVKSLNIPPKNVVEKQFSYNTFYVDEKFNNIDEAEYAYIEYKNEKNKRKRVLIKSGNIITKE